MSQMVKKRGPPKGTKYNRRLSNAERTKLCHDFMELNQHIQVMNVAEFLRSDLSGDLVSGTRPEQLRFGRWMKKLHQGEARKEAVAEMPATTTVLRENTYQCLAKVIESCPAHAVLDCCDGIRDCKAIQAKAAEYDAVSICLVVELSSTVQDISSLLLPIPQCTPYDLLPFFPFLEID